jgi:hypothetical protein
MTSTNLKTCVFAIAIAVFIGCSPPPPAQPSMTQGIRLSELSPPDAAQRGMILPPSVNLKVVTYAIREAEYERVIRLATAILDSGPGILKNADDFRANGFVAATGGMQNMGKLDEVMNEAKATVLGTNYYTIFDDKGDDVAVNTVTSNVTVPYARDGKHENVTLRPGQLALRAVVRRPTSRASVVKLTVQPVWKASTDASYIERTSGFSRDRIFIATGVDATMQKGDILLVAPAPSSTTTHNLAEVFMTSAGSRVERKVTIFICTGINQ